ncbi:MAG: hypothetical protein ACFFDW_10930 [Candidatus Thorarchaeota archaeon]
MRRSVLVTGLIIILSFYFSSSLQNNKIQNHELKILHIQIKDHLEEDFSNNNVFPVGNYSIITRWHCGNDNTLDVFVSEDCAFLANKEGGLVIINISDLITPQEIGRYQIAEDIVGAVNLYIEDDFAFVANDVDGARIFDISDKTTPLLLSEFHDETYYWDVYTNGNFAFFSTLGDGLEILDISDKTSPFEVAQYKTGGFIWSVYGTEDLLYIVDLTFGLEILNITDKSNPNKIGSYNDHNGQPYSIFTRDNLAFIAEGNEGLEIINISRSDTPIEICQYKESGSIVDVDYSNGVIFLANKYQGLSVLDFSEQSSLQKIGSYRVTGNTWSVFFDGEYVFLANGYDGLVILGFDSDNDDLSDYLEQEVYNTDYLSPDTDQDGFPDGLEVNKGTDPLDPEDYPTEQNPSTVTGNLYGYIANLNTVMILLIFKKILSKKKN